MHSTSAQGPPIRLSPPPPRPFAAILVWEEVWDLPDSAALSSWLLLLITAGAMVGSWFFERRIWCRSAAPPCPPPPCPLGTLGLQGGLLCLWH